jgi:dihydroflavonol-4-reductase
MNSNSTVLVTGANGFLGSHIVRTLLQQGYKVRAFVRPNANLKNLEGLAADFFYGQIDKQEEVMQAVTGCDYVVHAASITAQFGISYEQYEQINITATRYVSNACLTQGVKKLVFISTAGAFNPGKKNNPGTELNGFTMFRSGSGYIITKYLAQQYILEQVERNKLPAVIINPAFILGPQDWQPSSGQVVLYGLRKKLLFYPPGGKSFVHVQDVCTAVLNSLSLTLHGGCYLLAGENLSYKEFFHLLNHTAGSKKLLLPVPGFALSIAGSIGSFIQTVFKKPMTLNRTITFLMKLDNYYSGKKSERQLGIRYTPTSRILEDTIRWYQQNGLI